MHIFLVLCLLLPLQQLQGAARGQGSVSMTLGKGHCSGRPWGVEANLVPSFLSRTSIGRHIID